MTLDRLSGARLAIVALLAAIAYVSPPYGGFPWSVDAWLWAGIRDLVGGQSGWVPLAVFGSAIAAGVAGAALPRCTATVRRRGVWAVAVAVGAGVAMWLLRVRHWYGDFQYVDHQDLPWWTIEAAEPLGAFTSYYVQHWAVAHGMLASTAIAAVVTAGGATAVAAVFLWTTYLSPQWPLLLAMILSSGFMLIFFGYPEKGTPKSLALQCWYVYVTTRALRERRVGLQMWSSGLLSIAALLHGSALCWLPSHIWYVWRRAGVRAALAGISVFLAPIAAIALYVHRGARFAGGPWGNMLAPQEWLPAYCRKCTYHFWSANHWLDVMNCILILAPIAAVCWPGALARSRDDVSRWLGGAAALSLVLAVVWYPYFGYISDWDIFAITPMAITCHVAYVAVSLEPAVALGPLAAMWITASGIHAASWWRYFHLAL